MTSATLALPASSPAHSALSLAQPIPDPEVVHRHQAELREQGWTVFRDAMSAQQVQTARSACDALVADGRGVQMSDQHYSAANLVGRAPIFGEIACSPVLLRTIEGLLGDDCILSSCNLGVRRPGGERQGMHRDTGIWGPSMPLLDIPVGIQTAWCLDDFTLENGATHVNPGSHRRAEVDHQDPGIQAIAPAGSIIAFDARCFHAGGANRTTIARRGVLTLYIRSWLKPQTDHKRSYPPAWIADTDPTLLRLLGFQRQSPVEQADGHSVCVIAPGATSFYGQPITPGAVASY